MSSDLRTQFLNYMTLQRFAQETKRHYVTAVSGLAEFYNQSPDTLTNDQIQEYFRHLLEDRELSWGTCNNYFSGILSFYRNICEWDETQFNIPPRPSIKKLPTVFSMEEVKRLFAATTNLRKWGRWFQNNLTVYFKGDSVFLCQDSQDSMPPVLYIMLWVGALIG